MRSSLCRPEPGLQFEELRAAKACTKLGPKDVWGLGFRASPSSRLTMSPPNPKPFNITDKKCIPQEAGSTTAVNRDEAPGMLIPRMVILMTIK